MSSEEFAQLQSEIYTDIAEASKEIITRWNNVELRKEVEAYVNNDIPLFLREEPRAILARHIASPNLEFFRFLQIAEAINLKPKCFEYIGDRFVADNADKYYIGKLFIYNGKGKNGGSKVHPVKVIDFNACEGKYFKDIKTIWGEGFIEFHHELLGAVSDQHDLCCDASDWINRNGKTPDKFYKNFLALLICHGILFDNYLSNKNEQHFTTDIVLPNFRLIKERFGLKPLIVPLVPLEKENNEIYWKYYPHSVEDIVHKKLTKNKKES